MLSKWDWEVLANFVIAFRQMTTAQQYSNKMPYQSIKIP